MEILSVESAEVIESKEILLPFEETAKPDIISEIEEILIKEETLKPIPKQKRFRPSKKRLSSLSEEEIAVHNIRRRKRENVFTENLVSVLLSNPDYLAFNNDFYTIDLHSHLAKTLIKQKVVTIDKNFNRLTPIQTYEEVLIKDRNFYPNYFDTNDNSFLINNSRPCVVINMKKLILSRGKQFCIVYKTGIEYWAIVRIKRLLTSQIEKTYQAIEKLKEIVSAIYDENTYDILIDIQYDEPYKLNFTISVRFDHITIRNSIESERYLGTFVVYLIGKYSTISQNLILYRALNGIRTTFTVEDIVTCYHHSHLPRNYGTSLERFCIGSEDGLFSGLSEVSSSTFGHTEVEIQSVLLSLPDYLSWESLEGGPHYRMDDINMIKNEIKLDGIKIMPDNQYCSARTLKELINIIIQDPEYLKDVFILAKSKKGYEFTCNKPAFYEFVGKRLKEYNYKSKTLYNSADEKFYTQDALTSGSIKSMIEIAERNITNYIPAYINGEFIRPEIILKDQVQDPFQFMLPIQHPAEMMKIADVICKLLNDELNKDEYRKRK
jgi:hypothetical protein